jgi:hypothetical protein
VQTHVRAVATMTLNQYKAWLDGMRRRGSKGFSNGR